MSRFTRATVNVSALRHNLERVRALAPGRKVMAVVKANAYGHGLADVAHALSAADAYAVATVQEARDLRGAGVDGRIILLEGIHVKMLGTAWLNLKMCKECCANQSSR